MRFVSWLIWLALFLVALAFALKNTGITELHFFVLVDDFVWRAPLVVFLLLFFVAGTVLGLLGVVPTLFRQRREIGRLRREARLNPPVSAPVGPPLPDAAPADAASTPLRPPI
jgi:putative membrane protein